MTRNLLAPTKEKEKQKWRHQLTVKSAFVITTTVSKLFNLFPILFPLQIITNLKRIECCFFQKICIKIIFFGSKVKIKIFHSKSNIAMSVFFWNFMAAITRLTWHSDDRKFKWMLAKAYYSTRSLVHSFTHTLSRSACVRVLCWWWWW